MLKAQNVSPESILPDSCPVKQNGISSVTYHLFLKTFPYFRLKDHVGAREVTAHWFHGGLIHYFARGKQSLIQGEEWMSLKAELRIVLLGVNEDVCTPQSYIAPAIICLNSISGKV